MKEAALITGGAKRIGREISLFLASLGYEIALVYNTSREEAMETASKIKEFDVRCEIFKCNLTSNNEVLKLIPSAVEEFPNLSVLVNNASIFEKASIADTTHELLDRHLAVNFKTPFILSRDFSSICKRGNIINILDTRITSNRSSYAVYSLSKKTLAEFTKMAAIEFAPKIRVNGIASGLILPPKGETNEYLDNLAKNIPLKKRGNLENIKSTIKFFLENDYVTGQIVFCDGGEHLCK